MTEPTSLRPTLVTNDTLDAHELVGKLGRNGIAALKTSTSSARSSSAREHGNSNTDISGGISEEEIEDYDALSIDPDTLVDGSKGGVLAERRASSSDRMNLSSSSPRHGHIRRGSEPYDSKKNGDIRRRSIQIRLEKTDRKGRYILTADDPEIREILRKGMEREEAATDTRRTRIRDLVFTRQFTTFDRQNPASAESPFHGFFTLFWLAMVLMFIKVAATNWRKYGSILGNNEIMKMMFGRDVAVLGLTDVVMLSSTSFGFFLHKAILGGYLTWSKSGWIIQNIWQTFFLFAVVGWTLYRDWPWTHTIFIILHTMVFLMKQHSYSFYNGHLSAVYRRKQMLQRKQQQLRDLDPTVSRPTSPVDAKTISATSLDLPSANRNESLQNRRPPLGPRTATNLANEKSDVANVASAIESGQALDVDQMQAFERVIQEEIGVLNKELSGKNVSGDNAYPKNLNLSNFFEWSCLPTLVYELEYPRQEYINWWYVAEKTLATFGVIGVMMVISQAFIYPPVAETVRMKEAGMSLQERWNELPWIVGDMLFPLLLEQLLSWYVIWVSHPLSLVSVAVPLTCNRNACLTFLPK